MSVAQVILLCGRTLLLHRGVGWLQHPTPCPYIRLGVILDYIFPECKRFFRTLHCPGRFFCCSEGGGVVVGGWVARHGRGRGAYRRLGARRGQRWVTLHAIPRRGTGGDLLPCPRGNCVALTPAGVGWLRTAQPPDVCRLVKII